MNTTTPALDPSKHAAPADLPPGCIAPPCAQPLDGLHRTLYAAFLVLVAALLVAINAIPPTADAPPLACAAHADK